MNMQKRRPIRAGAFSKRIYVWKKLSDHILWIKGLVKFLLGEQPLL